MDRKLSKQEQEGTAKRLRASRSIDYANDEPVKFPPIKGGTNQNQTIEGSPSSSKERMYLLRKNMKEGKLKGKLSNKYNVDRIFPIYGCWNKDALYSTTTKKLESKFNERDPMKSRNVIIIVTNIAESSRQFFHKNDFMKKYTEEMLKAKNMMNNKH